MTEFPLISVIIPCHNVATTIAAAVRTVSRQLYGNIEIICVENGSTDNTLACLTELAAREPRLRVINSSTGLGTSRMAGVAAAKGDLIAFLDGDDFYEPDFLTETYAAMVAHDADLVQCAIRYIWPDRDYSHAAPAGVVSGEQCSFRIDTLDEFPYLQPHAWNKLYKRFLLDGCFIQDEPYEDAQSIVEIAERCRKFVVIPDPLCNSNKRFSIVTGSGTASLENASRYLLGVFKSQRGYFAKEQRAGRKKWGVPLPGCTYANISNYLRSVDSTIADADIEDQRFFLSHLQSYASDLRAITTPQECAAIASESYRLKNMAEELAAGDRVFIADPAYPAKPARDAALRKLEAELAELDAQTEKDPNTWIFATWAYFGKHTMDNPRAVFEYVKNRPEIHKVILMNGTYNHEDLCVDGQNVTVLPTRSAEGLRLLTRAGVIIGAYSMHEAFGYRRLHPHPGRKIIQCWHGIPVKRVGLALKSDLEPWWPVEHQRYAAVASSSDLDRSTMIKSFAPRNPERVKLTGYPRHDFLSMPESQLPADYRDHLDIIRARLSGRRLVLFGLTWRMNAKDRIDPNLEQLQRLDKLFAANNAVLGFRSHRNMVRHRLTFPLISDNVVQFGDIPEANILLRLCDALVSDYSGLFVDYLLLDRPTFLYTPDIDAYRRARGLNYEPEMFLPHETPITEFDMLEARLADFLSGNTGLSAVQTAVRDRFHAFPADSQATCRLLQASGLISSAGAQQ